MVWSDDYKALVMGWVRGHQSAYDFLETFFTVAHLCDDLTDRDTLVSTAQMQEGFAKALIDLPRNVFYQAHFALLNGAIQVAYLNWQIANRLEQTESDHAKTVAFILRSSYTDLITLCAWIVGGTDWAIQVGYESRLHASREGLATYLAHLAKERRQAQLVEG